MLALAALCLTAGGWHVEIPTPRFTLRWQHSIEKIEWDEDWTIAGGWLHLSEVRVRGSGAGMEPPPDARRTGGVWRYRTKDPWRREIVLARSVFVRDYELCIHAAACMPLSHWVPVAAGPTTLAACAPDVP